MLLFGAIGLAAIFAIETTTAVFTLDQSASTPLRLAKTLVTVDPNPKVSDGPGWYKLFTSVTMIIALLFAAAFTAGSSTGRRAAVDRPGRAARRSAPRSRRRRRPRPGRDAPLPHAARVRDPARRGRVRRTRRERRHRQRARAAGRRRPRRRPVGHAPPVTAQGARRRRRHLRRPREHHRRDDRARHPRRHPHRAARRRRQIANETRSLLALGLVRDVHRLAAALLAAKILGEDAESVVCLGDDAHLRYPDGRLELAELHALAG